MTPFHPDLENDAGHAINQDDLIAFHLHELSSPEERALRRVLHNNPALQSESLAIASTLRAFPKYEAPLPLDAAALDRHWFAIRNSLPAHIPPAAAARSLFPRALLTHWALPTFAGTALLAIVAFFVLHRVNTPTSTIATMALPPAPPSVTTMPPSIRSVHSTLSIPSRAAIHPIIGQPTLPTSYSATQSATLAPAEPLTTMRASAQPIIATSPAVVSPSTVDIATSQQPSSSTNPTPPAALNRTHPNSRPHYDRTTDMTLASFGNFTPGRSFTSTAGSGDSAVTASYTQSTTSAVGALASFHQQFRPWLGYRITAAHSEPTIEYTYQAPYEGQPSSLGNVVYEHVYEFSGTYTVRGPHHRRLSTSAEAGAGALAFRPPSSNLSAPLIRNAVRPTGVLGIAAEYALTRHLSLTAAYRLLLYKAPAAYSTFGSVVPPAPNNLTLSNEPVLGLTYRFHPTREE